MGLGKKPTVIEGGKIVCEKCRKEHPIRVDKVGDPIGSSSTLGRRLQRKKNLLNYSVRLYSTAKKKNYYAGSLQAHHLILSSTCNNNSQFAEIMIKYGYDINHKKNGELLPGFMDLACFLRKPVHNTNHDGGETVQGNCSPNLKYPTVVNRMSHAILRQYLNCELCEYDDSLIQELNTLSNNIRTNILDFIWTISEDGWDYAPGNPIGCGNVLSLAEKRNNTDLNCNCKRNHIIPKIQKYIDSLNN